MNEPAPENPLPSEVPGSGFLKRFLLACREVVPYRP